MRYVITAHLDDDDAMVDTTDGTGLSLIGYDKVTNGLMALGFDDIEVSADEGDDEDDEGSRPIGWVDEVQRIEWRDES